MKKYYYNSGRNHEQYKWSSQNAAHMAVATHTSNQSKGKLVNNHHYDSAVPTNGLINQHHRANTHFHSHSSFEPGSRPNKYVFINKSSDKEKPTKPAVNKLPVQHKSKETQHGIQDTSARKLTRSLNNVFRFTAVPKPVNKTCDFTKSRAVVQQLDASTKNFTTSQNNVFRFTAVSKPVNTTCNTAKSSAVVKQSCRKADHSEGTTTSSTNTIHQHKLNKKRQNTVVPSRSQLKWTSKDNVYSTGNAPIVHSKPQTPILPRASKGKPHTKQLASRSKFTWRRTSSGTTPRRRSSSSSSLLSHNANRKFKMIKSPPVVRKKLHRRPSSTSVRKIVYIGGVAYNATARQLSRRLSSGSSKKKLLAKNAIKKTGNKVWIAEHHSSEAAVPVHPGYEIRRKKGNWLWIPGSKSALVKQSALVRQANAIKHKYSACKSQLVSHHGKHRTKFLKVFIKNDVFVMDPSKRRLRRLSRTSLGSDSKRKSVGSVSTRTSTHQLASHAVRRSKALVWHAARKKKNVPKSEQYCMFFNRFGKCSRRDTCPYIHDPDKIAVCTRFLRGTCDKTDGSCPFSHHITKEKMPVCSYFLRGVCTKDNCPYLHVYVGEDAEICQDFVKGFCRNGDKCDKKHILDCPDFSVYGKCSKGDKCPLRHKKRVRKRQSSSTQAESREPKAFRRRRIVNQTSTNNRKTSSDCNTCDNILITPDQLEFIPLEQGPSTPPEFIAL